jgi:Origin recognition complex (ORC) subunit 5 C-terminus
MSLSPLSSSFSVAGAGATSGPGFSVESSGSEVPTTQQPRDAAASSWASGDSSSERDPLDVTQLHRPEDDFELLDLDGDEEIQVNVRGGTSNLLTDDDFLMCEEGEMALLDGMRDVRKSPEFSELLRRIPERRSELKELAELFGSLYSPAVPALLWGPGDGKATCAVEALRAQGSKFSLVDCQFIKSPTEFFTAVIAGFGSSVRVSSLGDFLDHIATECRGRSASWLALRESEEFDGVPKGFTSTRYVVIRHAELLSDIADPVLSYLLHPAESFPGGNLGVILCSTRSWDLFNPGTLPVRPPQPIFFRRYGKSEVVDILTRTRGASVSSLFAPGQHSSALSLCSDAETGEEERTGTRGNTSDLASIFQPYFRALAHAVVQNIWPLTQAIDKIALVVMDLFPRFVRPILAAGKNFSTMSDIALRSAIEPWLRPEILAMIQAGMLDRMRLLDMTESEVRGLGEAASAGVSSLPRDTVENLPHHVRWVIVGAFLASYIPRKDDTRFFGTKDGRSRQPVEGDALELDAPGYFDRTRLRYIVWAISKSRPVLLQIQSVVNSLVVAGMLETDSQRAGKRFKCVVDYDTASVVATSIDFNEFDSYLVR